MKKKILICFGLVVAISSMKLYAASDSFNMDLSNLSITTNSKKQSVVSNFNASYKLNSSVTVSNSTLDEQIKRLTKKTTYLLFGDANNKNETAEHFYRRRKDFYNLRYNPEVPKDPNSPLGLDTNSEEFADDVISGMAIPSIFNQANDLGLVYNSFGDIRIIYTDKFAISQVVLPNVKVKEESKSDPLKYEYKKTNYVMHYYYKKLNDEWKLYYLYGDSQDDITEYMKEMEEKEKKDAMSVAPYYESELGKVHNFDKLKNLSQNQINDIYNKNSNNVVYLTSYYNNMIVKVANGFFINDNLIVTTWNFLEKSLIEAQGIDIKGVSKNFAIEGIVTANPECDVAVIKVKDKNSSFVNISDNNNVKKEDPVISISSKSGVGLTTQTGIILENDKYVQTSIPLLNSDEGSPLFNENGEVIGINTSKSTSSSISIAINKDVLKEIQDKFSNIKDQIQTISFNELKEKYYYVKINSEEITKNVPSNIWDKYSKIGNIENTINLELVKSSYKDSILSLRFKNNIPNYITSIKLANNFIEELVNQGFKEEYKTTSKVVYRNNKYRVIIMDEFDYLIVVMVKG